MLGLVIGLIGGVAPRWIKVNGNIDVTVHGKAHVSQGFGKPKVKARAASKAVVKKSTNAAVIKGDKTMKTIGSIFNGIGKASSLPGE